MSKMALFFLPCILFLNCFLDHRQNIICDDCIHYAIKIKFINNNGSKILNVNQILLDSNGIVKFFDSSYFEPMLSIDSVYNIGTLAGVYDIKIINNYNDTIEIPNVTITENECNVITKLITIYLDSSSSTSKRSILNKLLPPNINMTDSNKCG